jgi:hypothetical protein
LRRSRAILIVSFLFQQSRNLESGDHQQRQTHAERAKKAPQTMPTAAAYRTSDAFWGGRKKLSTKSGDTKVTIQPKSPPTADATNAAATM